MKKVLKKFRSTNTIYEDFSMDLRPFQATGESNQTDVVESSGGKMFLTKGTKKQTRCMTCRSTRPRRCPRARCWKSVMTLPAA